MCVYYIFLICVYVYIYLYVFFLAIYECMYIVL